MMSKMRQWGQIDGQCGNCGLPICSACFVGRRLGGHLLLLCFYYGTQLEAIVTGEMRGDVFLVQVTAVIL